jgi:hypothetical protein
LLLALHSALCHFQCSAWQALLQYLQAAEAAASRVSIIRAGNTCGAVFAVLANAEACLSSSYKHLSKSPCDTLHMQLAAAITSFWDHNKVSSAMGCRKRAQL